MVACNQSLMLEVTSRVHYDCIVVFYIVQAQGFFHCSQKFVNGINVFIGQTRMGTWFGRNLKNLGKKLPVKQSCSKNWENHSEIIPC